MVTTFWPHLAYLIRRRDERIAMAMSWRPNFLSYHNYNGIKGDCKPRFDAFYLHLSAVLGDIILKWALHELLW